MEQVGGDSTLLKDLSEDELDSAFSQVERAQPGGPSQPAGPNVVAASERLHGVTGLSDTQRGAEEELARADALAATGEWFIESHGRPVGPLSTTQMKDRWAQGLIGPDTACWGNGLPGWTPICRIPELAAVLAPAPPGESFLTAEEVEADLRRAQAQEQEYQPRATPSLLSLANEELQSLASQPQPQVQLQPTLLAPQYVPWLQQAPPPPPAPAKGGVTAKVAMSVALAAVAGLVVGGILISAFTMQSFRLASLASTPAAAPPPPVAAAAPPPPPPAAAPARPAVAAPPPPAVTAPPAPPVEKPVQAARKPVRKAIPEHSGEVGEVIEPSPRKPAVGASSPGVEDDFDREFGGGEDGEGEAPSGRARKRKTVYLPPAPGEQAARDTLGQSDIMEVVVANKAGLLGCANAERQREPGFKARLAVRWTIHASGKTSDVEVVTPEWQGTGLERCVARLIAGWRFPEHRQARGPVTFPLVF